MRVSGRRLQVGTKQEDELYVTFTADLPALMASEEEYLSLSEKLDTASETAQTSFVSSFILQFIMSGALSMLWNIFNTMQILMALNLLMVTFPANVEMVFD